MIELMVSGLEGPVATAPGSDRNMPDRAAADWIAITNVALLKSIARFTRDDR